MRAVPPGPSPRSEGGWTSGASGGAKGRVPFGYLTHVIGKGLELRSADPVLQSIREVKDASEIALLKKRGEGARQRLPEDPRVIAERA